MLALLADSTFEFSIGALVGLFSAAVAFGILRHTVAELRRQFLEHEQLNRNDAKAMETRVRDLERNEDRRKGAEHAKHGRTPDASSSITTEYSRSRR